MKQQTSCAGNGSMSGVQGDLEETGLEKSSAEYADLGTGIY